MEFRPEEFAGKSVKLSSPVGQGHLEIWWPLSKDKEILGARVKELEETIEIGNFSLQRPTFFNETFSFKWTARLQDLPAADEATVVSGVQNIRIGADSRENVQ